VVDQVKVGRRRDDRRNVFVFKSESMNEKGTKLLMGIAKSGSSERQRVVALDRGVDSANTSTILTQ
jgi:hypothetical protein